MRAIIFDYFGVLAHRYGQCDQWVMRFIQEELVGRYTLAVLSNMSGGSAAEMLGEYAHMFGTVILSGDMGVSKPDERAFLEAARRLGEFPSDCVMIDDSQTNCVGAERAGMRAVYFQGVEELSEALKALEKRAIINS